MRRLHRVMMMSGLAVLLALVTATSAFAVTMSTVGASGRITTPAASDPDYCLLTTCLWATDTSPDGYCARWQKWNRTYAGWEWYGNAACTVSREELVAYAAPNGAYRLCRTGIFNCTPSVTVNW